MSLWQQCITELESLLPEEDVNTWIRSLEAVETEHCLRLVAPNASTREWIRKNCLGHISRILSLKQDTVDVQLEAGPQETPSDVQETAPEQRHRALAQAAEPRIESCLNPEQTFETFIEGKSNRLACAAAQQVAANPSRSFNPLLFYSGVGLGKTHLVHAIGNEIKRTNDNLRVLYLTSERFVAGTGNAGRHFAKQGQARRRYAAGRGGALHRREHPLEHPRTGRRAAPRHRQREFYREGNHH